MQIYNRADIVNFLNTGTSQAPVFTRMQGFTEGGKSLNSSTYNRRYIDEKTERSTVTGYSPEIAYNFDRIVGNAVHEKIAAIHDDEKVGEVVEILTVNMKTNEARLRNYSVIPDNDGDGTDAYQYSGTFGSNGDIVEGIASTTDDWKTCTFTPNSSAE